MTPAGLMFEEPLRNLNCSIIQFRDRLGRKHGKGRFIAFAAPGLRSQKRRVCFKQYALNRAAKRRLTQGLIFFIADRPGKRHLPAALQHSRQALSVFGKTVLEQRTINKAQVVKTL